MNADDMIKVLQADIEGKQIQERGFKDNDWFDFDSSCQSYYFSLNDTSPYEYRVKPEKQRRYVLIEKSTTGTEFALIFETREEAARIFGEDAAIAGSWVEYEEGQFDD